MVYFMFDMQINTREPPENSPFLLLHLYYMKNTSEACSHSAKSYLLAGKITLWGRGKEKSTSSYELLISSKLGGVGVILEDWQCKKHSDKIFIEPSCASDCGQPGDNGSIVLQSELIWEQSQRVQQGIKGNIFANSAHFLWFKSGFSFQERMLSCAQCPGSVIVSNNHFANLLYANFNVTTLFN